MKIENILPLDGEVLLYTDFFSKKDSDKLMFSLTKDIRWKQEPVTIMGKKIMQPRLTAWYGDEGKAYTYTGITMHPFSWTEDLIFIKEKIEKFSGYKFNSALLNFYRNGSDSVGWHRDNEKSLGTNPVIGSVSFGADRYFHFKHFKDQKLKRKILLTHGSLLLMKGSTQHWWLHSIQKEATVASSRINITFRTIF
ncbi:alpha-ketoglutarate-dependent dioxygenase AlkB family protein [Olivibacter domesticus]|uniref:Alkylated DNA repair dioxygenase AlkB n=1 Tax=Olivibacter domesticus TaxID=407022 RepID=A0A1H7XMI8_OLID1|nr:alpha-ketoglutarate-dependent dioxygenase AlkB [Olivibacter domesticus]SEM34438.1 Alkylated DNA repair dioxygenase AlkB [Olivibacter domesticus]